MISQRFRLWARSACSPALFAIGLAIASLPATAAAQGIFGKPASKSITVEVLDIGQGDSILIRSPEGKTALIDAGPSRDAALKLLKHKGVTSIDLVAISHHHSDHYGGMEQVLRAYKPRYFLSSESGHATKMYLKLLKAVEEEGITAVAPTSKPRRIQLGSAEITIFPQAPEDRKEENNNSIGLRLQYGNFSMLMTGDSETSERKWWIQGHPELVRDCTILKLAHHGSRNGTDLRWLQLVKPELAVASLGKGNDYGHPHAETLSLLKKNQVRLMRTDQVGTITIESDGSDWKVAQPNLARRGKPTQDDVDQVAATTEDEEPVRASSESRRSSGSSRKTRRK